MRKVLDPSCVGAPLVVDGHVAGLVVVKRVEEEYIPYFKRGSVDATTGRHGAAHVGGAGAGAAAPMLDIVQIAPRSAPALK